MPRLVRLYILNVLIGIALAVAFTGLLLWLDVAHLRHLILSSPMGWLAAAMLIAFNSIVFAGVQFGIAVMRMADDRDPPAGGRRETVAGQPVPEMIGSKPVRKVRLSTQMGN
ncbi:hypothetical protein [Paracoccus sp. (in: a-proteobacteria)]|uniref:hypothetical protein n=1 Tax=Paracoccus sp. TaxID=267 RepID=UPI003A8BBD8B